MGLFCEGRKVGCSHRSFADRVELSIVSQLQFVRYAAVISR